jgi:glycosyltransferase involved in cell wall biosynthesis
MPFILKEPYQQSKGVIVFTHKERRFLESPFPILKETVEKLRERYVIAMHWGHFHTDVDLVPFVDFHLAGEGTLTFKKGVQVRRIPLCSRNFIAGCFHDTPAVKQWDILCIARPLKLKNLDELLSVVRAIYDRGVLLKVLLICPAPSQMDERDGWYAALEDDYWRLFSEAERSHFSLMMLRGDGYPFPLSQEAMASYYNASKVFTLFSDQEGESRVIAEALLCGLPVVVKAHLRGGGRDYLTAENSKQFSTLDEACNIFIELLSNYPRYRFETLPLQRQLSEVYTAETLQREIAKVFDETGIPFAGPMDLVGLDRKLPSHHISLPLSLRSSVTNDLNSLRSALVYLKSLSGSSFGRVDSIRLGLETGKQRVLSWLFS